MKLRRTSAMRRAFTASSFSWFARLSLCWTRISLRNDYSKGQPYIGWSEPPPSHSRMRIPMLPTYEVDYIPIVVFYFPVRALKSAIVNLGGHWAKAQRKWSRIDFNKLKLTSPVSSSSLTLFRAIMGRIPSLGGRSYKCMLQQSSLWTLAGIPVKNGLPRHDSANKWIWLNEGWYKQ